MQNLKSLIAIIFVVVSLAVLAMTMGGGRSGAGPLFPQAIPYLGVPFGLGFLTAQALFCIVFDAKEGLIWMAVACVIALPLAMLGNAMNLYPDAIQGVDRLVTASACASALAVGFGVVNDKL